MPSQAPPVVLLQFPFVPKRKKYAQRWGRTQSQKKYYSVQKWIHDLLLKLPASVFWIKTRTRPLFWLSKKGNAQDSQRIKYLKPENKNRALNLFQNYVRNRKKYCYNFWF